MGEWLQEAMRSKSRIKALIAFNRREEIRKQIGLYTLLILLTTFAILEFNAILTDTRVVYIEVTHASMVKAAEEVSNNKSTAIEVVQGEKSQESITHLIERVAKEKGFKDVQLLLDLAMCESSMGTKLVNYNNDKKKSTDVGLFMINNYWHSEVSYEQAMDFEWSTAWTIDRINAGYGYEWMCWKK